MEKRKLKTAVIGLKMGHAWAVAAHELPYTELTMVYDKAYDENPVIKRDYFAEKKITVAKTEEEIYNSDADIVVVASPDHFHTEQALKAMYAGKHVACEKPLAPTVEECRRIVAAVKETGKYFMTGQVCRYAPAFKLAKQLVESGRIGEIATLECEYAHDYTKYPGWENWRTDPAIGREGFLGGGCHALDLARFLAGDPEEVFCYMNKKHHPEWPKPDSGFAVARFPEGVIGRIFVSIGIKAPYTMGTIVYGTKGTLRYRDEKCVEIAEESVYSTTKELQYVKIPALGAGHHIKAELAAFLDHLENGTDFPSDVYQGTKTVAFAEAAIKSSLTGLPEKVDYNF